MCQEHHPDGKWQVWANYITGTYCIGSFDTKEAADAAAVKGDGWWKHWIVISPEGKDCDPVHP